MNTGAKWETFCGAKSGGGDLYGCGSLRWRSCRKDLRLSRRRDRRGLAVEVHHMVDVFLRQKCDIVFKKGFRNTLAEVQVEGSAGIALHDVINNWTKESGRSNVVRTSCLGKNAKDSSSSILAVGVISRRANDMKLEETVVL